MMYIILKLVFYLFSQYIFVAHLKITVSKYSFKHILMPILHQTLYGFIIYLLFFTTENLRGLQFYTIINSTEMNSLYFNFDSP
jgi:hypothetical protein